MGDFEVNSIPQGYTSICPNCGSTCVYQRREKRPDADFLFGKWELAQGFV